MTVSSKSTDKIAALKILMEDMPTDRIKVFDLGWREIYTVLVPFVHVEFHDGREINVESTEDQESQVSEQDSEGGDSDTSI